MIVTHLLQCVIEVCTNDGFLPMILLSMVCKDFCLFAFRSSIFFFSFFAAILITNRLTICHFMNRWLCLSPFVPCSVYTTLFLFCFFSLINPPSLFSLFPVQCGRIMLLLFSPFRLSFFLSLSFFSFSETRYFSHQALIGFACSLL